MNILKLFKKKKKSFLVDGYRVTEAFSLHGVKYYSYDDTFKVPTGRALTALTVYEELRMRCSAEYLLKHTRAMEIILSDPKKINVQMIAVLNKNLTERLHMGILPDYIYRLASVLYFDDSESPYIYDYAYNNKKIEAWKKSPGTLDFFLTRPLAGLMPSLNSDDENSKTFSQVAELVDQLHQSDLQEVLSRE